MSEYIDELYELREYLKFILRREFLEELVALAELIDRSPIDSYERIKEQSQYGKDCGYAIKAKEIFYKLKEKDISQKIKDIYEIFLKDK